MFSTRQETPAPKGGEMIADSRAEHAGGDYAPEAASVWAALVSKTQTSRFRVPVDAEIGVGDSTQLGREEY